MTADSDAPETGSATRSDFDVLTHSVFDGQALLAGLELGLFTMLHSGPADLATIRIALGLHGRGMSDWLNLLVGNGLLERDGDRYRNTPSADRYLVRGSPSDRGDLLRRRLFPAISGLTESLRTGTPHGGGEEFTKVVNDMEITREFVSQMDSLTDEFVPGLIEAYDGWRRHRSVLDVGGCRGSVVAHILTAHPHLEGHVFDLPMMAPLFHEKIAERGLAGRVTFHPGDFFADPLPSSDVVMIGHSLVDWDTDQRRFLVRKAFGSVNPGGVLLVYDRMLGRGPDEAENLNLKFSLSMLVLTTGGSGYTIDELREHATAAGFTSVTHQPLGNRDTLATCHKPR
jgi:hypothetical protein